MLTNFEVVLFSLTLFILPIAVYSLLTGSKVPENTWASKYYAAEKYLGTAGNLFLVFICCNGAMKLAIHFGLIGPELATRLEPIFGTIFMVVIVIYLGLWAKAIRKVRRQTSRGSSET
jgi:hypothetical protein